VHDDREVRLGKQHVEQKHAENRGHDRRRVAEAEADEHHAQRLAQGKVYIPAQAARALQNFFRKDNLVSGRPCGST
jgi:hypothetical protein